MPSAGQRPPPGGREAAGLALGGPLTLGIRRSHQIVIQDVYACSFDRPARYTREYLPGNSGPDGPPSRAVPRALAADFR